MKFKNLGFLLTEDCNFKCSYCRQEKRKKYMKASTIEKAVDFFYPFLDEEPYIVFYGGEPLLVFDLIQDAVSYLKEKNGDGKKRLKFSITTNGSLITEEMIQFFDRNLFSMILSFDGLTQEVTRKKGTLQLIKEIIKVLQEDGYPGIDFSVNSVFTPDTISQLYDSLRCIINLGVKDIGFSIADDQPWGETEIMFLKKEIHKLSKFLVSLYKKERIIPVMNFRAQSNQGKSIFRCEGGQGRMAIGPGEEVWGCLNFHTYLKDRPFDDDYKKYSFGRLDDFMKNHGTIYPDISLNYAVLRQDLQFTDKEFCLICEHVEKCTICPPYAARSTRSIGKIPCWMCDIGSVLAEEKKRFIQEVKQIDELK